MTTIVTRAGKGSPLSWVEADANFTNLNTAVIDAATGAGTSNIPAGNISAVTVQDAINELDTEKAPSTASTAIGTAFTPTGNISATNVQAAINELDSEKAPISATTAAGTSNTPAGSVAATDVQTAINELDTSGNQLCKLASATTVRVGFSAEDALEIDSVAKTIKPLSPYQMSGNGPAFAATAISAAVGATETLITYTEVLDTDSCFVGATGRFTPNIAGWYLFTAYITNNVNVAATCISRIRKNGSVAVISLCNIPAGVGGAAMSLATLQYMNGTTDYVDTTISNNVAGYSVLAGNFSGSLVRSS